MKDNKVLNEVKAVDIAQDLLFAFNVAVNYGRPMLAKSLICDEPGTRYQKTYLTINEDEGTITIENRYYKLEKGDEDAVSKSTIVEWNDRIFEVEFYDSPDDVGFCSILAEYDPESYVICDIRELRHSGKGKYNMIFGFDIEKMEFLELFYLCYINLKDFYREANVEELESKLRGIKFHIDGYKE